MNPSPLTGERLAIVLEYRHTSSVLTLTSVCCSSYLHLALIETRGSITTAALPFGCAITALLLQIGFLLLAVRLPRFVMRQDVFLRLAFNNVNIMIGKIDWLYPITGGINDYRDASTCHAARDQHRHQAYG